MTSMFRIFVGICLIFLCLAAIQNSQQNKKIIQYLEMLNGIDEIEPEPILPNESQFLPAQPIPTNFTITAYSNRIRETDSDNKNTATMEKPISGWTCAISQDLIHWLGGRIYIEGIGVRKVNDLMNSRYSQRVDLFIGNTKHAQEFGKKTHQVVFLGR